MNKEQIEKTIEALKTLHLCLKSIASTLDTQYEVMKSFEEKLDKIINKVEFY